MEPTGPRRRPATTCRRPALPLKRTPLRSSTTFFSLLSLLLLNLLISSASASSILPVRDYTLPSSDLLFDTNAFEPSFDKRQSGSDTESAPAAFDSGYGSANMSSSCSLFFSSFLQDNEVKSCQPVSLLLMTSQAFFQATKSASTINPVIQTSCEASQSACSKTMASYAAQLKTSGACETDYQAQNPYVLQAYDGFIAYNDVYNATCMKAADSGNYCFVNAITDTQSPDSSYIYYLPLGISLPSTAKPACTGCLQQTLNGWANDATNGSTPLSSVYNPAVQQIDGTCGTTFAKEAIINSPNKNAAAALALPPWTLALAFAASMWLL